MGVGSFADEIAALRSRHPEFVVSSKVRVVDDHHPCVGWVGTVKSLIRTEETPWLVVGECVYGIPQAWVRMTMPVPQKVQEYGGREGSRMLRLGADQCEQVTE